MYRGDESLDFREMRKKLNEFYYLKIEMQNILSEIKEIRLNQNNLRDYKSVCITGMPKSTSSNVGIDDKVHKIIDVYESQINKDLLPELQRVQFELHIMQRLIGQLKGNEYELINKRYVEKKSWTIIGKELHYSRATVFRIHNSAIHNLVIFWNRLYNETK